jgi:hypothetical protein
MAGRDIAIACRRTPGLIEAPHGRGTGVALATLQDHQRVAGRVRRHARRSHALRSGQGSGPSADRDVLQAQRHVRPAGHCGSNEKARHEAGLLLERPKDAQTSWT